MFLHLLPGTLRLKAGNIQMTYRFEFSLACFTIAKATSCTVESDEEIIVYELQNREALAYLQMAKKARVK